MTRLDTELPETPLPEPASLDEEVRSLLAAIEEETVPDRLLEMALRLQNALADRRQRLDPN